MVRKTRPGRRVIAGLLAALGLMLTAPAAHAATLYVDAVAGVNDTQMGAGACTAAPPADGCNLQHAVETIAVADDNVMIAAGAYVESNELTLDAGQADVDLIGAGAPATTINSSAPNAVNFGALSNTASISGLQILHSVGTGSALVLGGPTVADRVAVHSISGQSACRVINPATVQNSVCRDTFSGAAAAILVDPPFGTTTVTLRNVTAYATGSSANALYVSAVGMSYYSDVNVRNSILRATGAAVDVYTFTTSATSGASVDLAFSDFADFYDPDVSTSVTPPTSANNITGIPVFDSADGNMHQAAGSPTIDKGSGMFTLGSLDLDGQARTMGSAPDIGADEFVPPPVNQPPITTPVTPTPIAAPPQTAPRRCKKGFKRKRGRCVKKKK